MAATTTLLGLVTPTQGTLSGTWGDTVNYGISDYLDIAIAGTLSFAGDGAITLANTTGSASGNAITTTTAQYMVIRITGTQTVAKVITAPSYSKLYMVDHAGATSAVTFKAAGQTGVSIAVGEKCFVYYNGTDYVKVASSVVSASSLTGTVAVANGGTSLTTLTANNVILGNGTSAPLFVAPSTSGNVLTSNGTTWASTAPATSGTVTSVSVVSTNGFAGTVATATTTPAITVSTSITGVLKGNGTAISAATAGTDYVTPTGTETLTNKTIAFGSNTLTNVAGTSTAQTFTGGQRGAVTALTSTSNSIAINLADNCNFSYTTVQDSTLAAPSNPVAGQSGVIVITQGATPRLLAYNTFYKFAGGTVPTLTATASAVDTFAYYVESATRATCQLIKDVK